MNIEIANACYGYLEALYDLNKNIIKLCGADIMIHNEDAISLSMKIVSEFTRIMPYSQSRKEQRYVLSFCDGLLEYKEDILYLEEDYKTILQNHYSLIEKIYLVRNKYEHKMHGVKYQSSISGGNTKYELFFEVIHNGEKKDIILTVEEFVELVSELNILYAKISDEIREIAIREDRAEYRFYEKVIRFRFGYFNDIYASAILREIGKMLYDF